MQTFPLNMITQMQGSKYQMCRTWLCPVFLHNPCAAAVRRCVWHGGAKRVIGTADLTRRHPRRSIAAAYYRHAASVASRGISGRTRSGNARCSFPAGKKANRMNDKCRRDTHREAYADNRPRNITYLRDLRLLCHLTQRRGGYDDL